MMVGMTVNESYKKFMSEYEKLTVLSCYEYDTCFVFEAVSDNFVDTEAQNMVFDSQFAVNKSSGEITPFKPFDIPIDEYKRGKRIRVYDYNR
jgi:hypothetical protein